MIFKILNWVAIRPTIDEFETSPGANTLVCQLIPHLKMIKHVGL